MVNAVVLVGRLTKDVQVNKTSKGTSVTNFTLAVQDRVDREKAHFIRCVAWGAQADFMGNYLGKGSLVSVEGEIHTGSYEDRDGKTVFTTEVDVRILQALESKAEREAREGQSTVSNQTGYGGYGQQKRYDASDDWPEPQYSKEETTQDDSIPNITSDDLPF